MVKIIEDKNINHKQTTTASEKNKSADLLAEAIKKGEKTSIGISGSVIAIDGKTLTVKKDNNESSVLNINSATPVRIADGKKPPIASQLAELKVGDAVQVNYDESTKNAQVIFIVQLKTTQK